MNLSTDAKTYLDTYSYPFESKFIELESGKMHYVDQGKGEVILFVHGTPTWSFLYRKHLESLSKNYRCIAFDHLGFGLSEKPENFDGTPESHAKNMMAFIDSLQLNQITLVVHDFGGPIGIGAALQRSGKIKRMVLFNTWLWATKDNPKAQKANKMLRSGLSKFLYLNMNFSPKILLKKGFYDRKNLPKKIHKQYLFPFPNKSSRAPLLKIGQSLVGSSDWFQVQWEKLDLLDSLPFLILWGTKDEFITMDYLEKWEKRLPRAKIKTFECGHFIQEEKTEPTINEIKKFMTEYP